MPQTLPELSLELWTQVFWHLQPERIQLGDSRAKWENVASDTCAFQALQQVITHEHCCGATDQIAQHPSCIS